MNHVLIVSMISILLALISGLWQFLLILLGIAVASQSLHAQGHHRGTFFDSLLVFLLGVLTISTGLTFLFNSHGELLFYAFLFAAVLSLEAFSISFHEKQHDPSSWLANRGIQGLGIFLSGLFSFAIRLFHL